MLVLSAAGARAAAWGAATPCRSPRHAAAEIRIIPIPSHLTLLMGAKDTPADPAESARAARSPPRNQDLADVAVLPHPLRRLGGSRGGKHRVDRHLQRPRVEPREDLLPESPHDRRLLGAAARPEG